MAYEKRTWENGDVITADKLNHIEDGISNKTGKIEMYNINYGDGVAIKASYSDLQKIISNGFLPFIDYIDDHGRNTIYLLSTHSAYDGLYLAEFSSVDNFYQFTAYDAESEMVHIEK